MVQLTLQSLATLSQAPGQPRDGIALTSDTAQAGQQWQGTRVTDFPPYLPGAVGEEGVPEKGFWGDRSYQVHLAQDLCPRTPQINIYHGGDAKFDSCYEWEARV